MADAVDIIFGEGVKRAKRNPRPIIKKIKDPEYIETMMYLHVELLKFQKWVQETNQKVLIIFEGRDAGGKGGTMKRFIEYLNPRGVRISALLKPTDKERSQWYMQRHIANLPSAGEIVCFDRSWYNRSVVERVMGFCSKEETIEFMRSVVPFEEMLVNAGILTTKLWFSVSKEEQLRRFTNRIHNPLKQWKISPVDKEAQDRWDQYTEAKEDTFYYTSSKAAPWIIAKSDVKKQGRINAIRFFLSQYDYPDKNTELLQYDKNVITTVEEELGFVPIHEA
jgi:polyphosphate kinase 2